MNAKEFKSFWQRFIIEASKNCNPILSWEKDKSWTSFIFQRDEQSDTTLIQRMIKNEFGFESWLEYKKIDLVVGNNNYFKGISYYDNSDTYELKDYPINHVLLLEHENNFKISINEMIKLIYEKAYLKVIITYPENQSNIIALKNNLSKILKQSNKDFPENSRTEYLLILGFKKNQLEWKFLAFSSNGKEFNI